MADNDFNVMQAQLGLTGGGGSMNPFGIPTPMPPMPQVRHPGEVARDLVQQTQSAAMHTMQTSAMVNSSGGAGFRPGGWGLGGFAQQYQQNMAGIQSQQLNPWQAGSMASIMGQQGYQPGMMPSPTQMTAPYMGIYRQQAPGPMASIPPTPAQPLYSSPFTPQVPPPMFSTPLEHSLAMAGQRSTQMTALGLSVPGVVGRAGVDAIGSRMGVGLGALMGARFGGAPGAAIGAAVGAIGGSLGTDHLVGGGVQHMIDEMNPIARLMRHSRQVSGMSPNFAVGGPNLGLSGRGLSGASSVHVARQLHDIAGSSGFQRETGGMFSTQDLMKITQQSGNQGLLDMAQRPEQITSQVKNIAKALKSFMQLASEPDVTEALKQLGQMRNMGLSLGESMQAISQARSFARAAGTSVRGVMEAGGLPGAMVFQQQGLSAGLGMQVGMGALGSARQAVAGGTFTLQQLSMLGGAQGVAQRTMETSAAMLKQPMMAAAMSQFNGSGFGLNAGAVSDLANGRVGIQQMATMGVNNMMSAVHKGGLSALGSFQMQQSELQDQLGKALGPQGLEVMGFQQIMQMQKMFGLKGPGGAFMAAKAMNLQDDQANQAVLKMSSPEFFQNSQRQIRQTRQEERALAREQRRSNAAGFFDKWEQGSENLRSVNSGFRNAFTGMGNAGEGIGTWFSQIGEDGAAHASGQVVRRTPRELLAANPLEARMIASLSYQDMVNSGSLGARGGRDTSIFRTPRGYGLGRSEWMADINDSVFGGDGDDLRNQRNAQGGLKQLFSGAPETAARAVAFRVGLGGMFASGAENRATQTDLQRGTESTMRGLSASVQTRSEARARLDKTLGGSDQATKISLAMEAAIAAKAKTNSSTVRDDTQLSGADYDAIREEVATAQGVSVDMLKANAQDLETVTVKSAKNLAGAYGGALRGVDFTGEGDYKSQINRLTQRQEDRGTFLMGELGGTAGIGDSTRRQENLTRMFGTDEDERVGTLAALTAAASEGDEQAKARREAYITTLRAQKAPIDALLDRAGNMITSAGKDKDMLSRTGKTLSSMSEDMMVATVKEFKRGGLADKKGLLFDAGLETLVDKNMIADLKDGDQMAQLFNQAGAKGEGLHGDLKNLAQQYHKTLDSTKRQALLNKGGLLVEKAGQVAETQNAGGDVDPESEKKARVATGITATAAAEALALFPAAVSDFAKAARALEIAADHLGNATVLYNSHN